MLDQSIVGREFAPFTVEVEKGRLRAFAKAIGEANPVYLDEAAAHAAGYPSLPAPPTFAFTIIMDAEQAFKVNEEFDIEVPKTVHGEQSFVYYRDICAGDVICGRQKIVDFAEKKGGALQFVTTEISLANQDGLPVCDLRTVVVVRNG